MALYGIYILYFGKKLLILKCWLRYVNDILILIYNFINIPSILNILDYVDPHVQYTIDTEHNNQFCVLDILVKRLESHFQTFIFRKSFAMLIPPYVLLNQPSKQKMASFYTYVYCMLLICSDMDPLSIELNYLKLVAINRSFDPSIIDKSFTSLPISPLLSPLKTIFLIKPLFCYFFYLYLIN